MEGRSRIRGRKRAGAFFLACLLMLVAVFPTRAGAEEVPDNIFVCPVEIEIHKSFFSHFHQDVPLRFYVHQQRLYVDGEGFFQALGFQTEKTGKAFYAQNRAFQETPELSKEDNSSTQPPFCNRSISLGYYINETRVERSYVHPAVLTFEAPFPSLEKEGTVWVPFDYSLKLLHLGRDLTKGVRIYSQPLNRWDISLDGRCLAANGFKNWDEIYRKNSKLGSRLDDWNAFFIVYLDRMLSMDYFDAIRFDYAEIRDAVNQMLLYRGYDPLYQRYFDLEEALSKGKSGAESLSNVFDQKENIQQLGKSEKEFKEFINHMPENSWKGNAEELLDGLGVVSLLLKYQITLEGDRDCIDQELIRVMDEFFGERLREVDKKPEKKSGGYERLLVSSARVVDDAKSYAGYQGQKVLDDFPGLVKLNQFLWKGGKDWLGVDAKRAKSLQQQYTALQNDLLSGINSLAHSILKLGYRKYFQSAEFYYQGIYSMQLSEMFRQNYLQTFYSLDPWIQDEDFRRVEDAFYLDMVGLYSTDGILRDAIIADSTAWGAGDQARAAQLKQSLYQDEKQISQLLAAYREAEAGERYYYPKDDKEYQKTASESDRALVLALQERKKQQEKQAKVVVVFLDMHSFLPDQDQFVQSRRIGKGRGQEEAEGIMKAFFDKILEAHPRNEVLLYTYNDFNVDFSAADYTRTLISFLQDYPRFSYRNEGDVRVFTDFFMPMSFVYEQYLNLPKYSSQKEKKEVYITIAPGAQLPSIVMGEEEDDPKWKESLTEECNAIEAVYHKLEKGSTSYSIMYAPADYSYYGFYEYEKNIMSGLQNAGFYELHSLQEFQLIMEKLAEEIIREK